MNRSQQKPLPSIPSSSATQRGINNTAGSTSSFTRPKAGGGRVLGTTVPKRTVVSRTRDLSPSPSTVSLASSYSQENGDVASSSNGTSPSLVCPICNEEMVTLLQLNRHLDDLHREVEEEEKDDVISWFTKRMKKAKEFQPVAVLNQKLKGLEVFEPNSSNSIFAGPSGSSAASARPLSVTPDPDELVTRVHWQRATNDDYCLEPICRKPLGVINGSVNCRKCGKLFCSEHTMYQIKLSRSAQHEPVRGVWCRVCETCYKSREGYNDHQGLTRDHTKDFAAIRRRTVDRQYLEITRLEKRLTKLTQLLANPPAPEGNSFLRSVSVLRNQRRALEQSVVPWEDDTKVPQCPYCKQTFSQLALRKHHCRLCGKVVCGDLRTGCSTEVGLNVAAMSPSLSEKPLEQVSLDVRICKECKGVVFCKRDFLDELRRRPAVVRQYDTLYQFQMGIKTMMPRFQKLLSALQSSQGPPSPAQLAEAAKIRKKLLDTFAQYDAASKRIRDLPTDSPAYAHLQKSVHQAASNFLHLNMLPLKSLPRILKANSKRLPSGLSTMSNSSTLDDNASQADSMASSAYEIEEKQLKEQQMLLEEQKFWVSGMLENARKKRKFDEIGALQQNVEELDAEIEKVKAAIDKLEMGM